MLHWTIKMTAVLHSHNRIHLVERDVSGVSGPFRWSTDVLFSSENFFFFSFFTDKGNHGTSAAESIASSQKQQQQQQYTLVSIW